MNAVRRGIINLTYQFTGDIVYALFTFDVGALPFTLLQAQGIQAYLIATRRITSVISVYNTSCTIVKTESGIFKFCPYLPYLLDLLLLRIW